jgi:hypothetical protein
MRLALHARRANKGKKIVSSLTSQFFNQVYFLMIVFLVLMLENGPNFKKYDGIVRP